MKPANLILPILCTVPALFGCSSTWDKVTRSNPAIQIKPALGAIHSKQTASDYYQIGRYYQGQNRLDKAEEAFRKALEIQSDNIETKNALGTVYSRQGKFAEAIEVFTAILNTKPEIAKVYNNLGYTYFLQGKHTEAIGAFEKALELEPQNPRAWNNIGLAHHKMGDEEKAQIAFGRAAELNLPLLTHAATNTQAFHTTDNAKNLAVSISGDSPKVVDLQQKAVKVTPLQAKPSEQMANSAAPHTTAATLVTADVVELAPTPIVVATLAPSATEKTVPNLPSANPVNSHSVALTPSSAELPANKEKPQAPNQAIMSAISHPTAKADPAVQRTSNVTRTSEKIKFHLEIANGNGITGMAKRTGVALVQKGQPTPRLSNFKPYQQAQTVIYYRDGYRDHALQLSQNLAVKPTLTLNNHLRKHTDVKLVLGKDIVSQTALSGSDNALSPLVYNAAHQGFEG